MSKNSPQTREAVDYLDKMPSLSLDPLPETSKRANRGNPLEGYDLDGLLRLRQEIDGMLPARALKDLNLEEELVVQFLAVKSLQTSVLTDEMTPANQKAQVAGQVASTLQQLVKMQTDLRKDEQLKRMETALMSALGLLPLEARELFFEEYELLAKKSGATT
jgi:hypothetical protein